MNQPVVLISASTEWRALCEILPDLTIQRSPYGEFASLQIGRHTPVFFHGGWGKISAAASTQYVLDHFQPPCLLNLGTCGGFAGRIEAGAILLVERTLVYDILEQMGDPHEAIDFYTTRLNLDWLPADLPQPVHRGLLISADRDILATDIPALVKDYGAFAADWESGAIAWVAARQRCRLLILRGVTDLVGLAGGEAYGRIELFHERTRQVIQSLLQHLPAWLEIVTRAA